MTKGDRPRPKMRFSITAGAKIKAIFAKASGERSKSTANQARVRFAMTHIRQGVMQISGKEVSVYRYVGYNYGKKWTGEDLVKIRARNGVGRPPDPARR